MAIYGRFGDVVTIVRIGTLDDVRKLDERKPDKVDHEAVENGSYVVVRQDNGEERLYHQAFLRADGGSREVTAAIEAVLPAPGTPEAHALLGIGEPLSEDAQKTIADFCARPAGK